jgi:hypothetical protein
MQIGGESLRTNPSHSSSFVPTRKWSVHQQSLLGVEFIGAWGKATSGKGTENEKVHTVAITGNRRI